MSIATIGASVEVWVYSSRPTARTRPVAARSRPVITSDGPPKVAAVWARTLTSPPRWLLVRKGKFPRSFEAVEGEKP